MQRNILRNSDIEKIYISYEDKISKKKFNVKLRFMDDKECYFAMAFFPEFVKPKRNTKAVISAYTEDGVYTSDVRINEATLSMDDLLFVVTLPKEWHFKQSRQSTRKLHELPYSIKFNDGFELKGTTYNISTGGISFVTTQTISSIYERIPGTLTLELSGNIIEAGELSNLNVEVRFVRKQINFDEFVSDKILYVWKFSNISEQQQEFLKSYIICID